LWWAVLGLNERAADGLYSKLDSLIAFRRLLSEMIKGGIEFVARRLKVTGKLHNPSECWTQQSEKNLMLPLTYRSIR
jgi:hypothetical protein